MILYTIIKQNIVRNSGQKILGVFIIKKRCCFAGHRDVNKEEILYKIKEKAEILIKNFGVKEFLVGAYGMFDAYAAVAIRELKQIYGDIELILIVPYLTKDLVKYKNIYDTKYDDICIAEISERTPKRYHIIKANEYMVNSSDYMICYIKRSWGDSVRTFEYAKKRIEVFNLADEI